MTYKYFHIAWQDLTGGQLADYGNTIMYTSGPTNPDELRRNVRQYAHKAGNTVIHLTNIQQIDKETFETLGGKSPE